MVKEYHGEFLHVIIDCNTGNKNLDKSIESSILGYVYLAIYCLVEGKFSQLIKKTEELAKEFLIDKEKNNKK